MFVIYKFHSLYIVFGTVKGNAFKFLSDFAKSPTSLEVNFQMCHEHHHSLLRNTYVMVFNEF